METAMSRAAARSQRQAMRSAISTGTFVLGTATAILVAFGVLALLELVFGHITAPSKGTFGDSILYGCTIGGGVGIWKLCIMTWSGILRRVRHKSLRKIRITVLALKPLTTSGLNASLRPAHRPNADDCTTVANGNIDPSESEISPSRVERVIGMPAQISAWIDSGTPTVLGQKKASDILVDPPNDVSVNKTQSSIPKSTDKPYLFKWVCLFGVLILASLLIPPYVEVVSTSGYRRDEFRGYHLWWSPPTAKLGYGSVYVDLGRLALQLVGLAVASGLVLRIADARWIRWASVAAIIAAASGAGFAWVWLSVSADHHATIKSLTVDRNRLADEAANLSKTLKALDRKAVNSPTLPRGYTIEPFRPYGHRVD